MAQQAAPGSGSVDTRGLVSSPNGSRAPVAGRPRALRRPCLAAAALLPAAILVAAVAGGWDVAAWLEAVWRSLTSVSPVFLLAALALQTLQTALAALAWLGILRFAYPQGEIRYLGVLACYATGVALNSVTPANAGTLVTVLMFVAIIPTATVTGVLAAAAVEKLFFAVAGVVVFAYLFVAVGGSFERKFGLFTRHPWAVAVAAVAAVVVLSIGGRFGSSWLRRRWNEARQGGGILSDRRAYLRDVVLPQVLSWCCKVAVVGVFLAAYGIPVGFHTIFSVVGGNALANLASLTPGGVGISQGFNVASLHDVTTSATASAYSIGQQLVTTVWNIVLAAIFVAAAFGRSGGQRLVEESSARARRLQQEDDDTGASSRR
jgi:uncharacterized membrane protein YbhN (UPF0104 family)